MLTKSVAVRYAKDNIRCNSVHPSTVDTAFVQVMFQDPERKAERLGEIPFGAPRRYSRCGQYAGLSCQ